MNHLGSAGGLLRRLGGSGGRDLVGGEGCLRSVRYVGSDRRGLHGGRGLDIDGMVGGDHLHQALADVAPVVVSRVHQRLQLNEEPVVVQGDGLADVDEIVLRLAHALLGHELLLIQLLPGPEAGVGDLDVHAGGEAGQLDQVSGQGVDLHGPAHVQHEDLAAVGIGPGQHHQAHRLGDGHEVPDHVRMGHGHGAAPGDLLLEDADHGAVAAQDVAEADRHELRLDILKHPAGAVLIRVLKTHMGEELRELRGLALLDLGVEALDDHLTEPLGGAHHVGGVHGLVRGDEHEPLAAMDHGRIGGLVGADHVVLHGLAGAVLHEGHVLVGGRVVNDLGAVCVEHLEDAAAVPDGADEGDQLQVGVVVLELQLNIVGVVLVDVEDDELLGIVGRDLPAELAADGAAAAGNQHPLAMDEVEDLPHVRLDGLPAQQVLHGHLLHGGHGDLARQELVHAGQLLELAVRLAADVQNVPLLHGGGAGDGQVDLVDAELLHVDQDVVPAAHHGDALQVTAPLVGVVVDNADHPVLRAVRRVHVPQDHLPCIAGADEHDPAQGFALLDMLAHLVPQQPIGEPDSGQQEELQEGTDVVVGERHAAMGDGAPEEEGDPRHMHRGGDGAHYHQPPQLRHAGVLPQAPIQPEQPQQQDRDHGIGQDELLVYMEILFGDLGIFEVVSPPQCGEPGEPHGHKIVDRHEVRQHAPTLFALCTIVPAKCRLLLFLFHIHPVRSSAQGTPLSLY